MSTFPPRPLVIAHRGDSAHHPENTLAAFEAAEQAGADAVELDIRLTADGVPVVMHDPAVGAATDGEGAVHELTLEEIRRFDAGGGERVPTLAEVLDRLQIGLDLEIKNLPGEASFDSPEEAILLATLARLEDSAFDRPVLISSFNWLTLERCRELRPDIETGFLTVGTIDPRASLSYCRGAGHRWMLPQAVALIEAGPAVVREAHDAGIRVGTWTVDDPDVSASLFAMGVDAVATNDPAALVRRAGSGENREGVRDGLE
ncbi:MAG TPA: glycerophosphodiester phosphodiesterase family protein [Actinomycetota bacterium]|nr:glycerophosphodiester phosphodiesterase family protein [Actinomycetota bacterium]